MLFKSTKIRAFCHFGSKLELRVCRDYVYPLNGMYNLLHSSFSSMNLTKEVNEPTELSQSAELPNWVKFSEKGVVGSNEEDDFVLPSISHWVENHKLIDQKVEDSVVRLVDESNIDKISRILNNPFDSMVSVSEALNGCGVNVSKKLVDQVLKRFGKNWITAFGFFKWAKMQGGFQHSPDSYNLMVNFLGKSKQFDLMWEVVEEMDRLGHVTFDTITKVMRRLAKACRYNEAIDAFKSIDRFRLQKDLAALNVLMDLLVKENKVELAEEVYTEFRDQITPNLSTYNILLRGWCRVRKMEKAEEVMVEMRKNGVSPDVISYTAFIDTYCHEKDFRKVDAIVEEMQEKGCPPNVVTYTIIMHALGKAKHMDKALEIAEKMKKNNCVPDSAFCSSLIHILGKAGRLKDAQDVFEDMPKLGLVPDVLTYKTMITNACRHSQEENALKLLQKMEENHCKPDYETYVPLLHMCCKLKRMKMISFMLSHMLKNDVGIGLDAYSLLISGLCHSRKLEHACSFFEEAVLRRYVPRENLYKELVRRLEEKGMSKAKERIEELMSLAKQQEVESSTNNFSAEEMNV